MLLGVEFVADQKSKEPFASEKNFAGQVGQAAALRGLVVYPMPGCVDGLSGDHLLLAPPAIITEEQIAWSVAQLRGAIQTASSRI
jgi:adenosylmethionine-8-amino-7-oxononanoate aminotransferase